MSYWLCLWGHCLRSWVLWTRYSAVTQSIDEKYYHSMMLPPPCFSLGWAGNEQCMALHCLALFLFSIELQIVICLWKCVLPQHRISGAQAESTMFSQWFFSLARWAALVRDLIVPNYVQRMKSFSKLLGTFICSRFILYPSSEPRRHTVLPLSFGSSFLLMAWCFVWSACLPQKQGRVFHILSDQPAEPQVDSSQRAETLSIEKTGEGTNKFWF